MELIKLLNIWYKYQLSLNWLNILFRYFVKLILLINVFVVVIGIAYKLKSEISQFNYLIVILILSDLLLKRSFKKIRQNLRAFYVIPKGIPFLSLLNIAQDIISPRNLLLPFLVMAVAVVLNYKADITFIYLFVMSCINSITVGFIKKTNKIIAVGIIFALLLIKFHLGQAQVLLLSMVGCLFVTYLRYGEKPYLEQSSLGTQRTQAIYRISNPYLWLDIEMLKKSRHLQLALVRLVAICLLYCYIIFTRCHQQGTVKFEVVMLIQVYYFMVPVILVPYILSSNHSSIGLLMTLPNQKSFFATKLNTIIALQSLLGLIICLLNYSNPSVLIILVTTLLFNIFIITPIVFLGILQLSEKVNVFDSGTATLLFIPSFSQSQYFVAVLACASATLYLFYNIGSNVYGLALTGINIFAFSQKEKFFQFFQNKYYNKKYKIFRILS